MDSIADALITLGWIQHAMMSADGVCLEGAIAWVSHDENERERGRDAVCRALGLDAGQGHFIAIVAWNDATGRTYDEVLRVAKHADEILGDTRTGGADGPRPS